MKITKILKLSALLALFGSIGIIFPSEVLPMTTSTNTKMMRTPLVGVGTRLKKIKRLPEAHHHQKKAKKINKFGRSKFTWGPQEVDKLKITINTHNNGSAIAIIKPYDTNGNAMENGYKFFAVKNGVDLESDSYSFNRQQVIAKNVDEVVADKTHQ